MFAKSASTIKRHIINLNSYLPVDKRFNIDGSLVHGVFTYEDYIHFISDIRIGNYISSQNERVALMVTHSFFDSYLNMTRLYQEIGMSLTTKKKDSKKLSDFIAAKNLQIELVPKKGISVTGDEHAFRLLTVSILLPLLEIGSDDRLTGRRANNPLERMLFNHFYERCGDSIDAIQPCLNEFLQENQLRLSYPARKFICLYLIISRFRQRQGFQLSEQPDRNLPVHQYRFFDDETENHFFNTLLSSMDFLSGQTILPDDKLISCIKGFIGEVQNGIITRFYTYRPLFDEIYQYVHKCLIRNSYQYNFYDNKLEDTQVHYPKLFRVVEHAVGAIENTYNIRLSHFQISTLTLIFRKFVLHNKVVGRNTKRLIIVSNSAIEKIGFFAENLKHYVDAEVVDCFNINEIDKIARSDYDFIVVFSNRIAMLLENNGLTCIKLNFYVTDDDINRLLSFGLSSNTMRKIPVDRLLEDIRDKSESEIRQILLNRYSSHFL